MQQCGVQQCGTRRLGVLAGSGVQRRGVRGRGMQQRGGRRRGARRGTQRKGRGVGKEPVPPGGILRSCACPGIYLLAMNYGYREHSQKEPYCEFVE